jgi:amidase
VTRLAVKDLIDVAGVPTTAGSRALANAAAAERDARAWLARGPRVRGSWATWMSWRSVARDVADVAAGLALLEPGFSVSVAAATRIGRIRLADVDVDPVIDAAVDAALARCGVEVVEVDLPGWSSARRTCDVIVDGEAAVSTRALLADPARRDMLTPRVRANLAGAQPLTSAQLLQVQAEQERWRTAMAAVLREVDLLALATVPFFPPRVEAAARPGYLALTSPVNLAGFPALALPVPSRHRLPASLQLIGAPSAEALLLATGATVEAAVSLCSERRPAGFRIAVISEPPPAPDTPRDLPPTS